MSDRFSNDLKSAIARLTEAAARAQEAISAAYRRGYAEGAAAERIRLAGELNKQVAFVFESQPTFLSEAASAAIEQSSSGQKPVAAPIRAPKGSIEPAVREALQGSVRGKTPAEIAAEKGLFPNSVRGALRKLRENDQVTKQGERWKLVVEDQYGLKPMVISDDSDSDPSDIGNGNPGAGSAGED